MGFIQVADLQTYLGADLTAGYSTPYLQQMIDDVSTQVQNACSHEFSPVDRTGVDVRFWRNAATIAFFIPEQPVSALSGLRWDWINGLQASITIDLAQTTFDYTTREGHFPIISTWAYIPPVARPPEALLRADYRAGHETVPTDVKRAVALLVQENITVTRAATSGQAAPLQSIKALNYAESYVPTARTFKPQVVGMGTPAGDLAYSLLRPYLGARLKLGGAGAKYGYPAGQVR